MRALIMIDLSAAFDTIDHEFFQVYAMCMEFRIKRSI